MCIAECIAEFSMLGTCLRECRHFLFTGRLRTEASWIRNFVQNHEDYKADSMVSERICYDLVVTMKKITDGELFPPDLLPKAFFENQRSDMHLPKTTVQKEEHLEQKRNIKSTGKRIQSKP